MLSSKITFFFSVFFAGLLVLWMQEEGATTGLFAGPPAPVSLSAPTILPAPAATPAFHKRRSTARSLGTAILSWSPNPERDLAGYRVYYGTASRTYGPPVDVGTATTFTASTLTVGATYYFTVTAYDTAGNESGFANEVSRTIQ